MNNNRSVSTTQYGSFGSEVQLTTGDGHNNRHGQSFLPGNSIGTFFSGFNTTSIWTIPSGNGVPGTNLPTLINNTQNPTPRVPAQARRTELSLTAGVANTGSASTEGWSWNGSTLTLSGANIYAPVSANGALILPANATIELTAGTVNTIVNTFTTSGGGAVGVHWGGSNLTIQGSGTLNATGGSGTTGTMSNSGIHRDGGHLIINNGIINATGGNNTNVNANSHGIQVWSTGSVTMNGGTLTSRAGTATNSRGINADTAGGVRFNGGTMRIIGNTTAFSNSISVPSNPHTAVHSNSANGANPTVIRSYARAVTHQNVFLTTHAGTVTDPFPVSSAADVRALATRVNGGTTHTGHTFIMTNDIDLGNIAFTPIGNSDVNNFRGIFNGNGFKITGLNVNIGTTTRGGLFGYNSGTIENLGVIGTVVGGSQTGGIVGINFPGNSIIRNSYFSGTVNGTNSVGGIAGRNDGTIQNCYNTATITGSSNSVGGITGENTNNAILISSYNIGDVSGTTNVGGIAGQNGGTSRIHNNTSLGLRVSGTAASNARIVGTSSSTNATPLSGNRARNDMLVNGVIPTTNTTETALNGGNLTLGSSSITTTFGTRFGSDIWNNATSASGLQIAVNLPTIRIMKDQTAPILPGLITITLNRQNGIGGAASLSIPLNTSSLSGWTSAPTRTGYTFDGYWTAATGGERIININGTLVASVANYTDSAGIWTRNSNVTLHARWIANTYIITLDHGDTNNQSFSVTYATSITEKIIIPMRDGFIFAGFFTAPTDGELVIDKDGNFVANVDGFTGTGGIWQRAENTNFYARWSDVIRSIVVNDNTGVNFAITENGMDELFELFENIGINDSIILTLTVEEMAKPLPGDIPDPATGVQEIMAIAKGRTMQFFDITVSKTINDETPIILPVLPIPIQVVIDLSAELSGRTGYSVYRYHDNEVQLIGMNSTDGEFFTISRGTSGTGTDQIIINTKRFSTYAVVEHIMALEINEPESFDVQARIIEDKIGVYRIDIAWGTMRFEYNIDEEEWVQDGFDGVNNKIIVTNRSNADVAVDFDITSEIDMEIKADENEIGRADTAAEPHSVYAFLEITGVPGNKTPTEVYEQIGIITITITADG